MVAVALTCCAIVMASLLAHIIQLRRRLDVALVATDHRATPSTEVITIEIRNPVDVAVSRTIAARPLAALAPGVLRAIVLDQTCRQMRSQMTANGVEADVHLRRLPTGT